MGGRQTSMGGRQIKDKTLVPKQESYKPAEPSEREWEVPDVHEWDTDEPSSDLSTDSTLFVSLYDFQPEECNQLNLKKGEKVHAAEWDKSKDWCSVINKQEQKGFVPANYLAPLTSLDKFSWYHGPISRCASEYLLRFELEGTFLVRESESNPGQFCISIQCTESVVHYRIYEDENGQYYIIPHDKYDTLHALIKTLMRAGNDFPMVLKYALARKNKPNIYGQCPGIPDKLELDRSELKLLEKLGSGQYGDVYKAVLVLKKKTAAVKTLRDTASENEFIKEVIMMKTLKHPNLIQLFGVCSKRTPLYMVMEFMTNGNLLDFLKDSSNDRDPTVLLYMAIQIGSAMAYLELKNYIHRDLAARNCLVGEDHIVKVADFGLARVMKEETYTAQSASLLPIKWTAPEGLAYSTFSSKSDVWAFGILLYEMVTYGGIPYPELKILEVYQQLECGYRMECPPDCPDNIYKLMTRCWEWEPDKRPTFKEIHSELDNYTHTNERVKKAPPPVIRKQPTFDPSTLKSEHIDAKKDQQKPLFDMYLKDARKNPNKSPSFNKPMNKASLDSISTSQPLSSFKDELSQKLMIGLNSDSTTSSTPKKCSSGDDQLNSPKLTSRSNIARPFIQPPSVPKPSTQKLPNITKPNVPPPLPPAKPSKMNSESMSIVVKNKFPVLPPKPIVKSISIQEQTKPILPSKLPPQPHSPLSARNS